MKRYRIPITTALMAVAIFVTYAAQNSASGQMQPGQMQRGMGDGSSSTMWNMGWGGSDGWGGLLVVVIVVLGVVALIKYILSNRRG